MFLLKGRFVFSGERFLLVSVGSLLISFFIIRYGFEVVFRFLNRLFLLNGGGFFFRKFEIDLFFLVFRFFRV